MSINENPIEIRLTPRFQKDLKILAKRYRSIRQDLQPLLRTLQTGQTPGDRIQGFNFPVFKVRLKNSDIKKGEKRRLSSYLLPANPDHHRPHHPLLQNRSNRHNRSSDRGSHQPT